MARLIEATVRAAFNFPSRQLRQSDLRPFEVIDGQHRLWAFEDGTISPVEVPVVAFRGLDVAWQAYLFWSINNSPYDKPSHAFDLYPYSDQDCWSRPAK